jgi:hypothetical protein
LDDQVTYELILGALNAAAADHHCVRWCQKKPVLVWYTLAASTLIILFVELLKLSPQKKNSKKEIYLKEVIEAFETFRNILFFNMENHLTDRC